MEHPNQEIRQNASHHLGSRIRGFYKLPLEQRLQMVANFLQETPDTLLSVLSHKQNDTALLDQFIENAIGGFSLPLGIATNFKIDGEDLLIPMAVEESSVVAACSYGAKLCREKGGFTTSATLPITTAQVQIYTHKHSKKHIQDILVSQKNDLIEIANAPFPRLLTRGGGVKDIHSYAIDKIHCVVLNIDVHTGDAMGANIVNTMAESIGAFLQEKHNFDIGLQILTNLSLHRRAKAECEIPASAFITKEDPTGLKTIQAIENAYMFARYDIHRAATHNKGIMNGIDPVVIATGNDWRAVEASAHAWAAHQGSYRSMSYWKVVRDDTLYGCLELPLPVGTVGGVTKLHPFSKLALKMLGNPNAQKLARIMVSVGLAQNLSALRALSVEGIQSGHMKMHTKNLELQKKQPN